MYQVGEYVVYGTRGICQVKAVGTVDFSREKKKLYYTLIPIYTEGSVVYIPVDTGSAYIRPIMTREEALALIAELPALQELKVRDEKSREQAYRDSLKSGNIRELCRIIKTIYTRDQKRTASGKKGTVVDIKYFKLAEETLYGELAVSLGISREEVKPFIEEKIRGEQTVCETA